MATLLNDNNPFAVVVLAHLQTQATRHKPNERYAAKMTLARLLYRRGYDRQEVLELFRFIDWMMALPEVLAQQFKVELTQLEEKDNMPYVTSVERIAKEEGMQLGLKQGLKQGLNQGLHQGLHQGLQQGLRVAIRETLEVRFGAAATTLTPHLEPITDVNQLMQLHKLALTAPSLAVFTQQLPTIH